MTHNKSILLGELLQTEGGIIKTETLNKNGFTSRDIKRFLEEGRLERIKHGYYLGKERYVSDIEIISSLVPKSVLCLFTAIEYYDLATVNPAEICIALPRDTIRPILPDSLCAKVYYMTEHHFEAGIIEVEVNGAMVRMYDVEKTVCDCFKYDNEVERNIALEVLKNYMSRGNCNIQKLLEYAKLLGKKKIIYPYVEALV